MRLRTWIILLALFSFTAWVVCAPAAAGPRKVLVFDFDEKGAGADQAWVGPALADYLIRTLRSSGGPGYSAVPRLAVDQHQNGVSGPMPFERKWELLTAMHGEAFVEGTYSLKGGALSFQGTVTRPAQNDILDISFTLKPFSIQAAQQKLVEKAGKAMGLTLKNGGGSLRGTESAKAYETYWKAVTRFKAGELARARDLLNDVLGLDSGYAAACVLRGRIAVQQGRAEEAAAQLEKCLAKNHDDPDIQFTLGLAYADLNKLTAARTHLRAAADAMPDNSVFQWKLGAFYRESAVFDKALDSLRAAVTLDESLAPAWFDIALIHAHVKNREKALDNLEKAVKSGGSSIVDQARKAPQFEWLKRDTRFFEILRSAPR